MKQRGTPLHYDIERESLSKLCEDEVKYKTLIHKFASERAKPSVCFPKSRREEIVEMKDAIARLAETKSQKLFIKKRNRVITNGWRDGILGVEVPGDPNSHFYSNKILKEEEDQQRRQSKRG